MLDQTTFSIRVILKGMSNNKGNLMLALYQGKGNYMKNIFQNIVQPFDNQKVAEIVFYKIPSGTYAISAYHDENANGKLDTNFLGIPLERYGFSNNPNATFGIPDFEKSKFLVESDCSMTIYLK